MLFQYSRVDESIEAQQRNPLIDAGEKSKKKDGTEEYETEIEKWQKDTWANCSV